MIIELSEYFAKDRYFSESAMQLRNIIDLINRSQLEENELKQIIETCNSKMKNSNNSTTSTSNSLLTWEEAKQILSTNEDPKIRLEKFYKRCYNENCKKYDETLKQIESIISKSKISLHNLLTSTEMNSYQRFPAPVVLRVINSIITQEKSFLNERNSIKGRSIESLCKTCADVINKDIYDNSKLDELKELFKKAFELFISNGGDNNYELFDIKVNSPMDNKTMRRSHRSPVLGTVKEFLFPGLRYKIGNRIIVQALVTLG